MVDRKRKKPVREGGLDLNPAAALLGGEPVDLDGARDAAGLDLTPDGLRRAQIAHESPGQWVYPYPAMSQSDAGRIASRWRRAAPTTFGATEKFDAEIVKMVPKEWWRKPDLIVTVRVRYPHPSIRHGVDEPWNGTLEQQ